MRYPASEKLEIIRTVEGHICQQSKPWICWASSYDLLSLVRLVSWGGFDGLSDKPSRPGSVWNRILDTPRYDLIEFALEHEALSARELA